MRMVENHGVLAAQAVTGDKRLSVSRLVVGGRSSDELAIAVCQRSNDVDQNSQLSGVGELSSLLSCAHWRVELRYCIERSCGAESSGGVELWSRAGLSS